jgi:hypothetical protein
MGDEMGDDGHSFGGWPVIVPTRTESDLVINQ